MSPQLSSPTFIPMGFAAQVKTLQDVTHEQAQRITTLERQVERQHSEMQMLCEQIHGALAYIDELKRHNEHMAARRTEAVSQLLQQRTLHSEAANAFQLRTNDIQPDDFEGMVAACGQTITAVMNHQQAALKNLRSQPMVSYGGYMMQHPGHHQQPINYAYPEAYSPHGWCKAHNKPYPNCHYCGA